MDIISTKAFVGTLFFCTLFTISCNEDPDVEPQAEEQVKFPNVDPELQPYFLRFEEEAAERGLVVDLTASGIVGLIEEIDEQHVAGQCSFSRRNPNRVTVDASFWNRGSDLFREFIVFHELGHCFLFREHEESSFANGICTSIMRSGTGDCFDNYRFGTREVYVDELFDGSRVDL